MIAHDTPGQSILIGPLIDADGEPVTTGAALYIDTAGTPTAAAGPLAHWRGGSYLYAPTQAETAQPMLRMQLEGPDALPVPLNVPTTRIPYQEAPDTADGLPTAGQLAALSHGEDTAFHVGTLSAVTARGGTLDASAPAGVNLQGQAIWLFDGPGKGQSATILSHDPETGVFETGDEWAVTPDTTTRYTVGLDLDPSGSLYYAKLTAGSTNIVEFPEGAPTGLANTGADVYITMRSGVAAGSTRLITAYDAEARSAAVIPPFLYAPAAGDWFSLSSPGRSRLSFDGLQGTAAASLGVGQIASDIPGMVAQLWRDVYGKSTYDRDAGRIDRFAADGTTLLLRQTATESGNVQTRGPAGAPS